MIGSVLTTVAHLITNIINHTGYVGLYLLMLIESAGIPAPSEVIMPFSGFLVFIGRFNLILVALIAALGNVTGSLIAYWIGIRGGRPLIERYGKYVLLSKHDIDLSDKFFNRYGTMTVFLSRLLPIIRTYISFPAGIARMPILPFVLYTFVGAFGWSLALAYIGVKLGQRWDILKVYFHKFDLVIAVVLILGLAYWIVRHIKNIKKV